MQILLKIKVKFLRSLRISRAGQLLIPSVLVVPSLLLFVYLIFETTKISREKIRQQFAVDSAAFIQMGDYTNLMNRTAYVNGAFPYRIFKERFGCPQACNTGTEANCVANTRGAGNKGFCKHQVLYDAGLFPKLDGDSESPSVPADMDEKNQWAIKFNDVARAMINTNPSGKNWDFLKQNKNITGLQYVDAGTGSLVPLSATLSPFKHKEGMLVFFPLFDVVSQTIHYPWAKQANGDQYGIGVDMSFYWQVYSLLGQVEQSQLSVFERLVANFNFFRKSYSLNTNSCGNNLDGCGEDGLRDGFKANKIDSRGDILMHYVTMMFTYGRGVVLLPDGYSILPSDPPYNLTSAPTKVGDEGLFQLATIREDALIKIGDGYSVNQGWTAPKNYFGVDLNNMDWGCGATSRQGPCVYARVASQCPQLRGGRNNCVWPNPTPKYQTRLYPN